MPIASVTLPLLEGFASSADAAGAAGAPVRVSHNAFDVQVVTAPAALVTIRGSEDAVNWNTLTDADGNLLVAISTGWRVVRERPEWVQGFIAQDASAPRLFDVILAIAKESS